MPDHFLSLLYINDVSKSGGLLNYAKDEFIAFATFFVSLCLQQIISFSKKGPKQDHGQFPEH